MSKQISFYHWILPEIKHNHPYSDCRRSRLKSNNHWQWSGRDLTCTRVPFQRSSPQWASAATYPAATLYWYRPSRWTHPWSQRSSGRSLIGLWQWSAFIGFTNFVTEFHLYLFESVAILATLEDDDNTFGCLLDGVRVVAKCGIAYAHHKSLFEVTLNALLARLN